MLALLFGQWRFSQAHIITWHSLTLSALILSGSYHIWGREGSASRFYMEALHQQPSRSGFVRAARRLAVMRKHAVNQNTERNILVMNDG